MKEVDGKFKKDSEGIDQEKEDNVNSTNNVNAASINEVNAVGGKTSIKLPLDPNMLIWKILAYLKMIEVMVVEIPVLRLVTIDGVSKMSSCGENGVQRDASLSSKGTKGDILPSVFLSSAVAKTINEEVQLHALVDGKRIVITETFVRRSLQLADAEVSKSKYNCME
ncbi:hypothetical protein Tco_0386334 [Tanacetum coccineum]